jgi:hypothetical protein
MKTQTMVERMSVFVHGKSIIDEILAVKLEGSFGQGIKWDAPLGSDFGGFTLWPSKSRDYEVSWPKVWTLGLAFGDFTLCSTKDSNSYIYWLIILNPFLWTLNKVWPFNPTTSRLGWP